MKNDIPLLFAAFAAFYQITISLPLDAVTRSGQQPVLNSELSQEFEELRNVCIGHRDQNHRTPIPFCLISGEADSQNGLTNIDCQG